MRGSGVIAAAGVASPAYARYPNSSATPTNAARLAWHVDQERLQDAIANIDMVVDRAMVETGPPRRVPDVDVDVRTGDRVSADEDVVPLVVIDVVRGARRQPRLGGDVDVGGVAY